MIEQALVFGCQGEQLLAVVTLPPDPQTDVQAESLSDLGLIIIVGGPQYRAGSHRQFVQLARFLAARGVVTMRFDTRGMGDSSGEQRTLEEIEDDVGAAIAALQSAQPQVKRVVLWGLCGGASAALLYWRYTHDPRLSGVVLVNPWVRSEATLARTRLKHYYLQRLGEPAFWRKLFSGRVAGQALRDLLDNLRLARQPSPTAAAGASTAAAASASAASAAAVPAAGIAAPRQDKASLAREKAERPLQQRMGQAWQHFGGPKLVVLSENDYTAKEFIETVASDPLWAANMQREEVSRFDVPQADHTFSNPQAQRAVEQQTLDWLVQRLARRPLQGSSQEPLQPAAAASGAAR